MNRSNQMNLVVLMAVVATLAGSAAARADAVQPTATGSDSSADIASQGKSGGQSQDNFGRFVKKSKAEFDADAQLKAQFKNYGQYVSSLRRHDGEHSKGGSGEGGGKGSGEGHGSSGGTGNGGSNGHGHSGGSGAGSGSGGTVPPPS